MVKTSFKYDNNNISIYENIPKNILTIDGIDYQILVEADFLVNIYEDSLPQSSAISVLHKIFKTKCGIKLLRTIYSLED